MKRALLILLINLIPPVVCLAQAPKAIAPRSEGEKQILSPTDTPKAQLSKEEERRIAEARRQILASPAAPCSNPIAVSVQGGGHVTGGGPAVLTYSTTITNVGGAWVAPFLFLAPCSGLFYFNVDFVKDSYYYGGTQDDVTVMLYRSGTWIGSAWSGEGAGRRGTGAYGVTLLLQQGDYVFTMVQSDGGPTRHLAAYAFTGFLIR